LISQKWGISSEKKFNFLSEFWKKGLNPKIQTCDICPNLQLRKHTKAIFPKHFHFEHWA
jgi:hypothetical protein